MSDAPKQSLLARLHIDRQIAWEFLAVLCLSLIGLSIIQFGTPGPIGNDGYYHIRMADIMRREGLTPTFVWLPLTILNPTSYYDHHFLYHVLLGAATPVAPGAPALDTTLIMVAKVLSAAIPALAFALIGLMLRREGVRWAWLWALALFAVSDAFLYRMSMVRAQAASLLVLVLAVHWLLRRNYAWLIPLGFLYVWLYNAFPLLLIVAGTVFIATWISEGVPEWKAMIYPAIGLALGVIVNPYFPQNVLFIVKHILPKLGANSTGLGIEWEPYNTWVVVENSTMMLAFLALSIFALGWERKRMDRSTLAAFGLMIVFSAMLLKSRRFIEYAPAFVLIFAALAIRPLLEEWLSTAKRREEMLWAGFALILLAAPLARSVIRARDQVALNKPVSVYASGALWLRENTPPGTMIFQTDWDDFTRLFFYDPRDIYTAGLDPTYLELADKELYDEWVEITRGRVEQPSTAIREDFGGEYVFTDTGHTAFLDQAANDPGLREVFRDDEAVIFEVLPGE